MVIGKSPMFMYEGSLTFGAVTNSTTNTTDITVTLPSGVAFPAWGKAGGGAAIHLELPDLQAGLMFCNAWAVTSTTMKVRFYNPTAGSLTPTGTNAKLVMI